MSLRAFIELRALAAAPARYMLRGLPLSRDSGGRTQLLSWRNSASAANPPRRIQLTSIFTQFAQGAHHVPNVVNTTLFLNFIANALAVHNRN